MNVKLNQIRNSLVSQNDFVSELVNDICDGIEKKYKKDEESYNFCVDKNNSVYRDMDRIIAIFKNFDIDIIVFRDMDVQVIYTVYFYEE